MLPDKSGRNVVVTPVVIAAMQTAFPWLGQWSPLETRETLDRTAAIGNKDQKVTFCVVQPPLLVPLAKMPLTVAETHIQLSVADQGITHIWGGPTGRRSWHDAHDLNWVSVLNSLTLADEGLMVRTLRHGNGMQRIQYVLTHWGMDCEVAETVVVLRDMVHA